MKRERNIDCEYYCIFIAAFNFCATVVLPLFSRFSPDVEEFLVAVYRALLRLKINILVILHTIIKNWSESAETTSPLICYMLPNQLKAHDPLNEGSGNRKQIFLKSCHNITTLGNIMIHYFLFSIQDSLNSNRLWEAFHNLALSSLIH